MLGIRDIFVRIRILGSVPLTNESGSGCGFRNTGTFTSFFKDKSHKEAKKTVEIKVFCYYFCLMMEGSGAGSVLEIVNNGSDADPGGPKTYGSGFGSGSPTLVLQLDFFVQEDVEEETYDEEQEEESREAESFQSYIAGHQDKISKKVQQQRAAIHKQENT